MVLNSSRRDQLNRIQAEVQQARTRTLVLLAQDYAPAAQRLNVAYQSSLESITTTLSQFTDQLTPSYPANYDPQAEGVRAAVERFRNGIQRDLAPLQNAINAEVPDLQRSGAARGYEAGLLNLQAGGVGVQWNTTTQESIVSAINYVDKPAFNSAVSFLGNYHGEQVGNLIIAAVAQGENPRTVARIAEQYFTLSGNPLRDAERLARTTQIYAARTGTNEIYKRYGVERWMWSANLGNPRTCLACIAMHGTLHPTTEILNDHHNGRCAAVPITPTWESLGLVGGEPQWETGVNWFARQEEDIQRQAMGPALYYAWNRGMFQFTPQAVVGTYNNPIFGEMRRRKPNYEIVSSN